LASANGLGVESERVSPYNTITVDTLSAEQRNKGVFPRVSPYRETEYSCAGGTRSPDACVETPQRQTCATRQTKTLAQSVEEGHAALAGRGKPRHGGLRPFKV